MLTSVLLPDTLARNNGAGSAVAVDSKGKPVFVTLGITRALEHENLALAIEGSADGVHWHKLGEFPPESYCGTYTMKLDCSKTPDIRYLRVEWKMERWIMGEPQPLFEFSVLAASAARA